MLNSFLFRVKDHVYKNKCMQIFTIDAQMVDGYNFFEEKYKIAKTHNPNSPMMKINALGSSSIILFSHDLVKQWQHYELKGEIKRIFFPFVKDLLRWASLDSMNGPQHLEWRKKAKIPFKPQEINQLSSCIQESAENVLLRGIYDEHETNNDYIYFTNKAKKFAFEVGIKYVLGPLVKDDEIDSLYDVCCFSVIYHCFFSNHTS